LSCSGFFVCFARVKIKPAKRAPAMVVFGAVLLLILFSLLKLDLFERLERMTFDMRARTALRFPGADSPAATNLGFVYISEESVRKVRNGSVGFSVGLLWPRQVYGRLVEELRDQGAKAVAFDVMFGELRPDHASVVLKNESTTNSDEIFATACARAGNVILAVNKDVMPPELFATNAAHLGHIATTNDSDGVMRRTQAFIMVRKWHFAFEKVQRDRDFGVDLNRARIEKRRIVLPRDGLDDIVVPLDEKGDFDLTDFGGDKLPSGVARKAKPFTEQRVWHMGIVLAAQELGLDLDRAEIDLQHGWIRFVGAGQVERILAVDRDGYFFVNWTLPPDDPRLTQEPIESLLAQQFARLNGETNGLKNRWSGKLAVVGSSAVEGNNLTDTGATPLSAHTLLVSEYWNVANSLITNRFVHRANQAAQAGLIVLLGLLSAGLTWQSRIVRSSFYVGLVFVAYVTVAFIIFVQSRYWLPVVLPLASGGLTFVSLLVWRLVFEEAERRRIKSIFGTVVSPKILDVLLESPSLALGGARRQITVMFADVRGFTELTDTSQARVAELVRSKKLTGAAAEMRFDEQARETLETVNTYLGIVADAILSYDATLDKFIGDCVMAFWGAPAAQPDHALLCVRAAIAAQRAIYELNLQRSVENQKRELENLTGISAGLEAKPLLPILLLGTGINSGMATVGLMGSGAKQKNYTVFGREVNLASRLEGISGRGRIFISESTLLELRRADAALAETCVLQPPAKLKGISADITVYEVPWRPPGATAQDIEALATASKAPDSTTITSIIQRG
jgi:class 3 adenylate cyclase/CHASE2 domain-containing sensor protein